MPKLEIYNLILEVTRRCNMNCEHCLRGEAENADLTIDTIIPLLKQVSYIGTLTFSGGEPSLNTKIIRKVLDYCDRHDIQVSSFYIVTNGKEISDEFLALMHRWYAYVSHYDDPTMSGIALSKDTFHENIPNGNENLLRGFSFFREDKITNWETKKYTLIQEGRAKDLVNSGYLFRKNEPRPDLYVEKREYDDEDAYVIDEELYVSVNGDIIPDCDCSYDTMKEISVGNTKDIEAFFEYLETQSN